MKATRFTHVTPKRRTLARGGGRIRHLVVTCIKPTTLYLYSASGALSRQTFFCGAIYLWKPSEILDSPLDSNN